MTRTNILGRASAAMLCATLASGAGGCSEDSSGLRIETETAPLLMSFRDAGATDWTSVAVAGETEFELEVAERYELVLVCERTGARPAINATQYARTLDDGDELRGLCPSFPFTVSGTMVQAGQISIGPSSSSTTRTNWQFALSAKRGTFDLLLLGMTGNFMPTTFGARRDLAVTSDLNLGTIDLDQEDMQPLVQRTYQVSNALAEERARATTWLLHEESAVPFFSILPGATAALAPDAALTASDRQLVEVGATQGVPDAPDVSRSVIVTPDTSTPITLPDPLGAPRFQHEGQRSVATWTSLPEYDELRFLRAAAPEGQPRQAYELRMSYAYAAAIAVSQLELDFSTVPGFKPEWNLAPNASVGLNFAAGKGEGVAEGNTSSSASEPLLTISSSGQRQVLRVDELMR